MFARSMPWRRGLVVVVAVALGACGAGDGADSRTTTTSTTTPSSTSTSAVPTSATAASTTGAVTSTTAATTTTTSLPGEEFTIAPQPGAVMAVVGVAYDDVLNLRWMPGTDQPVVAELSPTADDLVATGRARALTRSIWFELTADGVTGWASARYLGYLGLTDDYTHVVVSELGEIPMADTMQDLGRLTAEVFAVDDPEAQSSITVTVPPTVGDLGEVTYDVVGLLDDAQLGFRLHVFGQPGEGGGFSLMSVEATVLCGRGVTEDGLCP